MFQFDVGLIVSTEVDEDGWIGLQVDVPGEKKAGIAPGQMFFPYGDCARPHDPALDANGEPNPAEACGAVYAYYGERLHVWAGVDPRIQRQLPKLAKGGRVLFGGPLSGVSWFHFNGDTGDAELHHGAGMTAMRVDAQGVALGNADSAVPIALATQLSAYLDALEQAITTAVGAAGPTGGAAAAGFTAAMQAAGALRSQIAATLVKGF